MRRRIERYILLVLLCTVGTCLGLRDGFVPIPNVEADKDDPATLMGYKLVDAAVTDHAVCLDGTPGMYYHRKSSNNNSNWFIYHEGGGWCMSLDECYARSKMELGSSKNYADAISNNAEFFSIHPSVNPMMHDWNMVYFKYCDGNSFSGSNSSTTPVRDVTLHWRGKHILNAGIRDLLEHRGLHQANHVVISGCSAGGLSTFLHCDTWAKHIYQHSPHATVKCVPQSGLFVDYNSPRTRTYHSGMTWAFHQQNASVHEACLAGETPKSNCMFAQHTMKYLEAPTFPLQSTYDTWQLVNDLDSNDTQLINKWGQNLTSLVWSNLIGVSKQHGAFLDSCAHHCQAWNIAIDNDTQAIAMQKWYYGDESDKNRMTSRKHRLWIQNESYPCKQCCGDGRQEGSATQIQW